MQLKIPTIIRQFMQKVFSKKNKKKSTPRKQRNPRNVETKKKYFCEEEQQANNRLSKAELKSTSRCQYKHQ